MISNIVEALNFKAGWLDTLAQQNSQFSKNFCFYETEFPVSEKFIDFHVTLDNFFVSMKFFTDD